MAAKDRNKDDVTREDCSTAQGYYWRVSLIMGYGGYISATA
jgi:hypothetical protein